MCCTVKILIFTEISKRGYPTFWTAPLKYLYSKRDLNPHSRNGQGILSPSCLPIPPFEHPRRERAENETRTRDPNLGKVMLYQLSYFRVLFDGCKDKEFYNTYQILHPFFLFKNVIFLLFQLIHHLKMPDYPRHGGYHSIA